jgi:hypothetical protein
MVYIGLGFAPVHQLKAIKSMGYLGANAAPLKGGLTVCTLGPLWGGLQGPNELVFERSKKQRPRSASEGKEFRWTEVFGAVKLCPHHMSKETVA